MRILVGCEMTYAFPQVTPVITILNVHSSRGSDLERPDNLVTSPSVFVTGYRDVFGNWCNRFVAPIGRFKLRTETVVRDDGLWDQYVQQAEQFTVQNLPSDTLQFLLGSRYCETDRLTEIAWNLFGKTPLGAPRVKAICDYVHNHIIFGYEHARPTKGAFEAYTEGLGVCRDYAHLAVALCRCLNIPARYCTGYMGDIGVPVVGVMDFSAWFEVYLSGRWYTFDARNNRPRMARVLIARGRDATDVPIANTFGVANLVGFKVVSEELPDAA